MDIYDSVSELTSKNITLRYSTSFSSASRLFGGSIRSHIFNIYGMVRVADEIVDTYRGSDSRELLDSYEQQIYTAPERGYSTDLTVHAFVLTANEFGINETLIKPFFSSMRTDLKPPKNFSQEMYRTYIHGSAEVIGLMCLSVFCGGDTVKYTSLSEGAAALGSAFQKVNFLRDLADDTSRLGRNYFPNTSVEISEADKQNIIRDISEDFTAAYAAAIRLPSSSRTAVMVAYAYYRALLRKLSRTSVKNIQARRIRISNIHKLVIISGTALTAWLIRRPTDV